MESSADDAKDTFKQKCRSDNSNSETNLETLQLGESIAVLMVELLAFCSYGYSTKCGLFASKSRAVAEGEDSRGKT